MKWFVLIQFLAWDRSAGWDVSGVMTQEHCEAAKAFIVAHSGEDKIKRRGHIDEDLPEPHILECVPVGDME